MLGGRMTQQISMVIAGSTGLVGQATLNAALTSDNIQHVYSLSRRVIEEIEQPKLTQWIDPELTPPAVNSISPLPVVGVIALGSTLKKAGSKDNLYAIDVELVTKVAKSMQLLGIQHIIVVSCIGASTKAISHYLRCKGEMEEKLQQFDIRQVTFLQPGPLAGPRKEKRRDERLLQYIMKLINPLLLGALANYKPIESIDIARTIIHLTTKQNVGDIKKTSRFNTPQMLSLLKN